MRKRNLLNVNTSGNKKLVNNDKTRFLIWNLPAVKTCPNATTLCINGCYARKAEKVYPGCLASREQNYNDSLQNDFTDRMIETITYWRNSKAYAGKKMIVRIHESGDFYSQEYTDKWMSIIEHFQNDNSIIFHCYTKSLPFFRKYDIKSYSNLAFISSIWADTDPEMLTETVKKGYRVYTAVESFENWTGNRCRCSDCAKCQQCMNNNIKNIACQIH